MKKNILFLSICTIAIVIFSAFKIQGDVLPIGSALPNGDIKMKDILNREVSLLDAKKKNGLLVMFSCNTCPYVIKNQERTKAIAKYALQNKIGVILLNSNEAQRNDDDSFEAMKTYAKNQGYKWYYAVDKNAVLADAFGANRTPENFLFNKNMKLVYHGAIDDNPTDANNVTRQHLKEAIMEISNGKEVSVKESRSVGCSIKRKG